MFEIRKHRLIYFVYIVGRIFLNGFVHIFEMNENTFNVACYTLFTSMQNADDYDKEVENLFGNFEHSIGFPVKKASFTFLP